MLPLYCRLPHGKVKRRFDEVSKVVVRSWARQSSGLSDPHPEVWRHRLRFMLKHVLWFVAGLARVQAFRIRIPKSGDIGYVLC